MADVNPTIWMTVNWTELNNLIKGRDYQISKKNERCYLPYTFYEDTVRFRDANRLNVKWLERD